MKNKLKSYLSFFERTQRNKDFFMKTKKHMKKQEVVSISLRLYEQHTSSRDMCIMVTTLFQSIFDVSPYIICSSDISYSKNKANFKAETTNELPSYTLQIKFANQVKIKQMLDFIFERFDLSDDEYFENNFVVRSNQKYVKCQTKKHTTDVIIKCPLIKLPEAVEFSKTYGINIDNLSLSIFIKYDGIISKEEYLQYFF